MFPDNNWYGNKEILFKYCNIKKSFPIYGTLQHGWFPFYDNDTIKEGNFLKRVPYFCWSKKFKNFFEKKINIKDIGSPFLYLHKMQNKYIKNAKGTIFFPAHSSPEDLQIINHSKIIKLIKKEYPAPYYVSLYFSDYKRKIIKLYKNNNFKIYCFGQRGNIDFTNKLYKAIVDIKFSIFTEVSSATIYCMYLKKNCRIVDKDENGEYLNKYSSPEIESFKKKKLYKILIKKNHSKNKLFKIACDELGFDSMKSPEQLKKILNLNNYFYKFLSFLLSVIYDIKYGKKRRVIGSNFNLGSINTIKLNKKI